MTISVSHASPALAQGTSPKLVPATHSEPQAAPQLSRDTRSVSAASSHPATYTAEHFEAPSGGQELNWNRRLTYRFAPIHHGSPHGAEAAVSRYAQSPAARYFHAPPAAQR